MATSRAPVWQCCQCLVIQQVRRCTHLPVKSAHSNTGGTLRRWLWQHTTDHTRHERLSGPSDISIAHSVSTWRQAKNNLPNMKHKIQGVYIHTDSTHITIKPCQQRIQQITMTLKQAIDTNSLQPSLAQKLAGKCAFTATQLFGKVGRAANRALYDHAFSNHTHLDRPTKQGILAMIRHSPTRTATCRSTSPSRLPTNHHLHRCLLPDWRGTTNVAVTSQKKTYNMLTKIYPMDGV